MEPRIETLPEKKLIGKSLTMSLTNNRTSELWRSFMPERKEIKNSVSTDLFNLQVYPDSYSFKQFNYGAEFEKWAAVEVSDFNEIPEGMKTLDLKTGLYAVFIHKGPASEGEKTFKYIFTTWLPNSEFDLDNRPHFEVLGDKYKNNQPDSEEEVWIPIRRKA
jgi:AraC family transcriptional regulator